jgi:hypothetical protein
MTTQLEATIPQDGSLALAWRPGRCPRSTSVLLVRTGAVPAYTALRLGGELTRYQFNNLSRHQRYRVSVLTHGRGATEPSPWLDVTPRVGVLPRAAPEAGLQGVLATVTRLTVMPQDQRVTAWWKLSPGFVDQVVLEVGQPGRAARRFELEPEVRSFSVDQARGVTLENGQVCTVRLGCRFGGQETPGGGVVEVTPAPAGSEREANRAHPQVHVVYPCATLGPEVAVFPEDETGAPPRQALSSITCVHCRGAVTWQGYQLRCGGCGAEFIPTGRGDYLDFTRLRFGTCRCCQPRKILVQDRGSTSLRCAHSGKEHIRVPGEQGHFLLEDLPFGLCQCCRPRRPMHRRDGVVKCVKTGEPHRLEDGRYVLVPTEPVFDAAAIDDLLDAGLAEICATGVSRGRR